MKVAIVEFTGRGGLIHYTWQLARAMHGAGADVVLITDRHFELASLPRAGLQILPVLRLWDPKPAGVPSQSWLARAGRKLRRALRAIQYQREWARLVLVLIRVRPDIVQFGDMRFPVDVVWLYILRGCGFALADICHNIVTFSTSSRALLRRSPVHRLLLKTLYHQFALVFVHYERNRTAFIEAYHVDRHKVTTVPHGHEGLFAELRGGHYSAATVRHQLRLAADDKVVMLLGTLTRYKGVDLLIRAFGDVVATVPNAKLVCAGYPAADFDIAAHRRTATAAGIGHAVTLVPHYIPAGEVAAWIEAADVVALPYRVVFQSGAAMLAHTFGVPVVAADVGAIGEMIVPNRTGLLVPPDDPGELARALVRLLLDDSERRRMGEAAHEHARRSGDWNVIARQVLARYADLLRTARETALPTQELSR